MIETRRISIILLSVIFFTVFVLNDTQGVLAKETEGPFVSANVLPEENSQMPASLLIPAKLDFVIDPLEICERGQIYSATYIIKNMSENIGLLKISDIRCEVDSSEPIVIHTEENEKIRREKEKGIYIELLFSNGDTLCLSEEKSEYELKLKPLEEITFTFRGTVSESPEAAWEKGDVNVVLVYDWKLNEEEVITEELSENTVSGNIVTD